MLMAYAFSLSFDKLNFNNMTSATLNIPEPGGFFAGKDFFTILPEEVNQLLRKDFRSIIVDVRETEDFIQGHVPNAINLPRGNWGKISGLQFEQAMILYSYSSDCPLAGQAMQEFARNGYPVIEMEGGFKAWKETKLPVEI